MDNKAAWIIKIVFAVLIIFIVVEVVLGLRNIKRPVATSPKTTVLASQSGGKIALIADKTKYRVGENINVSARIFTGGHLTDGADLIISFDPNFIEATSSGIARGQAYSDYPAIAVSKGKIAISGISTNFGFNGMATLASFTLKARQAGSTVLTVDYTGGSTTDSNIIETKTGKDILDQVNNLTLSIVNTAVPNEVAGQCADRVYTQCTDNNGKSGTYWCGSLSDGFTCSVGCFKEKTGKELGCKVL